ncbi:Malate transport protein [uncultured delta proteobacterium]|uniref:Malate transport protein n=1 Tax=uncultured delta proteobacterium TaxID=34034 RepID=A0A212J2D9_9DELT|nr:Malate transport protein [uncultured delta proteobacterium]
MTILNAFSGVSTIFLLGLLGFILARRGYAGPEIMAALPRFLTLVALPPFLLRTVTTTVDRELLLPLLAGTGIPFISMLTAFSLAVVLTWLLHTAPARKGMFRTGFATSNAMTIGLPINLALFGETGLPYALIYFFGNATFFWVVGCYSIARSGQGTAVSFISRETLKRVFSPPMIGFCLGLLLVYFDVRLPAFLDKTCKYVGDMVVALGTMYVGMMVSTIKREDIALDKDIVAVLAGRFLVSPLLIILLTNFFAVPPLMRNVFIIQASLPVMINAAIISAYYKTDIRYATIVISFSTVLSIITIPLYMTLIVLFLY